MKEQGKDRTLLAKDQQVYQSLIDVFSNVKKLSLTDESSTLLATFANHLNSNKLVLHLSTDTYKHHMEGAEKSAGHARPFGVEMQGISPSIKLILYPAIVFAPTKEHEELANKEEMAIQTEGTQSLMYFLDSFHTDGQSFIEMPAYLLFAAQMSRALHERRYPLVDAENSLAFRNEVKNGVLAVREYLMRLQESEQKQLPADLRKICILHDDTVDQYINSYLQYSVEPMKPSGLFEKTTTQMLTPQEAIEQKISYLRLDQRNLPKRPSEAGDIPSPKLPWTEFTTNRWNRDHQLFGSYEYSSNNQTISVDYKLDSTHFPSRYGFFDTIEIIEKSETGIKKHIILGQEVVGFFDVEPIVMSGDFDLSDDTFVQIIIQLTEDPGVKKEIALVLQDTLSLHAAQKLQRIPKEDTV